MKIFDMKNFPRQNFFSGIAELERAALNNFFRQMENPKHNNWEFARHPAPVLAKKYFVEFKSFIRENINLVANSQIIQLESFTAPENKSLSSGEGSDNSKYKRTRAISN